MNVTDGLRFKLDDLGVEWTVPDESWNQSCITYWTVGGIKWVAFESENDTLLLNASSISDLTPEQAIAATLGPRTCRLVETEHEQEIFDGGGYFSYWSYDCDECGHENTEYGRFCAGCGAKVVDE